MHNKYSSRSSFHVLGNGDLSAHPTTGSMLWPRYAWLVEADSTISIVLLGYNVTLVQNYYFAIGIVPGTG